MRLGFVLRTMAKLVAVYSQSADDNPVQSMRTALTRARCVWAVVIDLILTPAIADHAHAPVAKQQLDRARAILAGVHERCRPKLPTPQVDRVRSRGAR